MSKRSLACPMCGLRARAATPEKCEHIIVEHWEKEHVPEHRRLRNMYQHEPEKFKIENPELYEAWNTLQEVVAEMRILEEFDTNGKFMH